MFLSSSALGLLQHASISLQHSLQTPVAPEQIVRLICVSCVLRDRTASVQQLQFSHNFQYTCRQQLAQQQQLVQQHQPNTRRNCSQHLHFPLSDGHNYQLLQSQPHLPASLGRLFTWRSSIASTSHGRCTWMQQATGVVHKRGLQTAAVRLPVEKLQEAITPAVCNELSAKGYAVVDGVFGATMAHQLGLELLHVWEQGLMHLNHTHLVNRGQTTVLAKSQVMEAELTLDPHIRAAAPLLAQLDADHRLQTMLNLFTPQLRLESHTIKMQHNEGSGGCFPMHFDSDELLDGRRVTAIFYLNQAWNPSHGGELRLYPFPAPTVDISPLHDRLVLFASTRMLHRVLPSKVPRSCFTIWLSEGRTKAAGVSGSGVLPPPAAGQAGDELWKFLMQPAIRQHVCKLAYADEWEQSIRQSHPDCNETDAALTKHRQEVEAISRALSNFQPGLQHLIKAASLVQRVTSSSAEQQDVDGSNSGSKHVSQEQLQEAVGLLRRAAAFIKWF